LPRRSGVRAMSNSANPPTDPPDEDPQLMEGPDPNRAASAAPDEAALHQGLGGGGHDPYAAWRSANFRIFIAGNTCISLGLLMVSTAINYQIFHLTGLPRSVAWLGLAQALPVILLSLPAGQTADRHSRKMIMVVTAVLLLTASLCLAVLTGARLSKWQTEAMLLALASAEAAAGTFFRPARNALLASLVPAADFANAVTWNSTLWELASVIGPAAAGWLIAVDIRTTYAAAAVLQLVMIPAMLILRPPRSPRQSQPASFAQMIVGVRFVLRTRQLLGAMTLDLFAVLFGGVTFLLPAFAADRLNVGPAGFGLLRAAPSFGAIAMALLQAHSRPLRHAGRTMMLAVTGFGAATVVFAFSRSYVLSMLMLVMTGACDNISVVVRHTLVQLLTPDAMRGRVSAVNQIFIGSSNELGGMESGLTAWAFGIVASAAMGGILSIATVIAIAILFPELRRLGKLADARPEAELAPVS